PIPHALIYFIHGDGRYQKKMARNAFVPGRQTKTCLVMRSRIANVQDLICRSFAGVPMTSVTRKNDFCHFLPEKGLNTV
ncbi:MAG: hypothetical protein ACPHBM_04725, partial [Flavobacteriales bacterium]